MQTPEMEGSEIVLLDRNLEAAREICAAGKAIAAALRKEYKIRVTRSETSAFRDADFVIITITTGGFEMMAHDLSIPEKYGIFQTVGDTVGPGGWSRTLRNVPVFVGLARKIEKYARRAVVLNYTNPMASLTGAIIEASSLRTVGLCHGVFSNYYVLEKLFGVREEDLAVKFGGVNHFFWITDFAVKGMPGYPLLWKRLEGRTLDEGLREGETDEHGFHSHHALCGELYREYGYLTYVGDRHTCEFLPGYVTPTASRLKRFKLVRTTVKQRYEMRKAARKRTLDIATGKLPPFKRSRETAVDIMKAIVLNKPFVDVVNLPNTGQIDNLPRLAVVETLGLVDRLGFRAITIGSLPDIIEQMVAPHCKVQQMTLEAALTGNKKMALESLMMDPICSHLSPSQVRSMGRDLMEATKE